MKRGTDFDYAHARLHARHAERPDERAWRELHTARTAGQLLAIARRSGLGRWVAPIDVRQEPRALVRRMLFSDVEGGAAWV